MTTPYTYHHQSPVPIRRPNYEWEFKRRGYEWEFVGGDVTAVPSETYPYDPAVLKAIRDEIDPNLSVLWMRYAYRAPSGSVEVFGRHALALWVPNPESESKGLNLPFVLLPTLYHGPMPNKIQDLLDYKPEGYKYPIPGVDMGMYVPFDWSIYRALKRSVQEYRPPEKAEQDANEFIARQEEKKAEIKRKADAEVDYRFDHDSAHIRNAAENISGPEIDAIGAPQVYEPKPMVHVKQEVA